LFVHYCTSAYIIGGAGGGVKVLAYFLVFLAGDSGASGFAFGGRPTGLKVFNLSRVSGGYTFSDNIGSIPATWSLCRTVTGVILRAFDSSVMVYPSAFISTLSDTINKTITLRENNTKQTLTKIKKKREILSHNVIIMLDLIITLCDNKIMG
jgi:hypothetical protein